MASTVNQQEAEFVEAANSWNLEQLYIDLASAKGKSLTPVEKKFLRGLLCGYSPAEIAEIVYKSRNSSAVRVYLSNGLYKYIQEQLIRQTGDHTIQINIWSRVTYLLEKAGYRKQPISLQLPNPSSANGTGSFVPTSSQYPAWEQMIDVEVFYGRQEELNQLEQWIINDSCRLVALLGMGGTGKTALAVKLAEQVQDQFQVVIWRSLRHTPPIEELLANLLHCLLLGQAPVSGMSVEAKISQLMTYLRTTRCLLILDQAEAVLCSGQIAGYCAPGCEGYGELFRRLVEERHTSCVLLTSREKPKEIASVEGAKLAVRSFLLRGLPTSAGQELLSIKGLAGSAEECRILVKRYAGNPFALKIAATTIQEVFEGKIGEFLAQAVLVFGEIRELLDQQFNRLSAVEKSVMHWLAVHQKLVYLQGLPIGILPDVSKREQIETFESLRRRSLLDKTSNRFILPQLMRAYLTEKLVEQVCAEMTNQQVALLVSHTLINTPLVR